MMTRGRSRARSRSRGPCQSSFSPNSDATQLMRAFSRNMMVASGTATVGTTAFTTSCELYMSTVPIHPNPLAVLQLLAAVEDSAHGRQAHLTRDDRAVREHTASLYDESLDSQEQRRPARIGGLRDQDRVFGPIGG